MGTTAAAALSAPGFDKGKRAERIFFSAYTFAIALVIFAGFAPSFFLRGIVPDPEPLDVLSPPLLVHGLLAAAYIFLFPVQAALISAGQRRLHIAVGNWGFAPGAHGRNRLCARRPRYRTTAAVAGYAGRIVQASIAMLLMLAPLWVWDIAARGKLHWATALGTGVYFVELAFRPIYVASAGWARIVESLPGYGWP